MKRKKMRRKDLLDVRDMIVTKECLIESYVEGIRQAYFRWLHAEDWHLDEATQHEHFLDSFDDALKQVEEFGVITGYIDGLLAHE